MDKKQIASLLDEMGTLYELKGENPFKCRAFHNVARVVETLTSGLDELVDGGEIRNVKGIGEHLSKLITEMVKTDKCREYEQLRSSLPEGLLTMMRIPGLGPKRTRILYEKLKIKSIDELQRACATHKIAGLDGFGEKTEENILKGIELVQKSSERHLYPNAEAAAEAILAVLLNLAEVRRCEFAGSLRRKRETIGDVDILASAADKDRSSIVATFVSHPDVDRIVAQGDTKASVILKAGINCDLRIVSEQEYPFALNYFTGSKEHNVEMRTRAKSFGLSLNEYGFTRIEEGLRTKKTPPRCKDEAGIYSALGLAFIPPELREGMGEIEAALRGKLPELIQVNDIQGTFHCHTTYSDGLSTLEAMAEGARDLGWKYLGIADHSKSAAYAGGLSAEKVRAQLKEIDTYNAKLKGFRLFKGTEVDILADGTLDYSDKLLSSFDYVVASIHSKFKMSEAEATARMIKAVKNKYVTMVGHPTGRLLLSREGYPINMIDVINAASDFGKGIEINAHPMRFDLDWRLVRYAKEKKVPIYINPDAHDVAGLRDVFLGVGIARKGWLEARDVVNTWPLQKVETFLKSIHPGR